MTVFPEIEVHGWKSDGPVFTITEAGGEGFRAKRRNKVSTLVGKKGGRNIAAPAAHGPVWANGDAEVILLNKGHVYDVVLLDTTVDIDESLPNDPEYPQNSAKLKIDTALENYGILQLPGGLSFLSATVHDPNAPSIEERIAADLEALGDVDLGDSAEDFLEEIEKQRAAGEAKLDELRQKASDSADDAADTDGSSDDSSDPASDDTDGDDHLSELDGLDEEE